MGSRALTGRAAAGYFSPMSQAESAAEPAERITFWPLTDVGRVRDHNEDSFLVDKKLNLFIVADGMGGHAAGEVASQVAARTVRDVLAQSRDMLHEFEAGHGGIGRHDILRLLESAVQQAGSAVYNEGQEDESKRGMGTTIDALLLIGSRGFIAHVGDSRVYLYRQSAVHQLTEDHSLINELLKRGRLSREQIEKLQYKNAVTRAVGVYESVEVDTLDFDVLKGEVVPGVRVYDLSGRLVKSVAGRTGREQVFSWDGTAEGGNLAPPGMYVLRVEVDAQAATKTATRAVSLVY